MSKVQKEGLEVPNPTENGIARQSGSVFAAARKKHLAQGQSVLVSRGNAIYRLTADGEICFVKSIGAPRKVKRGMKITLR